MNAEMKRYNVDVHGISGFITFDTYGVGANGRWASHTGYRSIGSKLETNIIADDVGLVDIANSTAKALWLEQKAYPFCVGKDHADVGWQTIQINLNGLVQKKV